MNADGSESSGIILLKRPGRMRFEYDKPDKTLVLVAAGALAIFDPKGDQEPITYPVRNNPISLLLNSEIDLINSGIVSNYIEASEEAVLIIRDPITPESGSVELLFAGAQPELKKFTVKNENGTSTSIALEDTEYPKNINDTFIEGDRVLHKVFGRGRILNVQGIGGEAKVTISFSGNQIKKFILKYANLVRL